MRWILCVGMFLLGAALKAPAFCGEMIDDSTKVVRTTHPYIGTEWDGCVVRITLSDKKQRYSRQEIITYDADIHSPKSVSIHPAGGKFYVNSLEGGTTCVYDLDSGEKLKVISHDIGTDHAEIWASASGYFSFNHQWKEPDHFSGKPVESVFSHKGAYLWVPYYRRSFDINAQEPSAMAVIDTETDEIVRLFETGPLPKMVAVSPDGCLLAVTHWGDNTVGIIDISSGDPVKWRYTGLFIIGNKLNLNFSLNEKVDRDNGSGYCLRGTVFTPDNRYLLVGCMGGGGGIAIIDLWQRKYLGRVTGTKPNLRHLVIKNGSLYASINSSGYVQKIRLDEFEEECGKLDGDKVKTITIRGWVSCKVPGGARTIDLSPGGGYIFVACNIGSCIAVIEEESMRLLGTIPADSFPVGLDVSKDGRYLVTTSQGRRDVGGNAVDIYKIEYRQ